MKHIINTVFSPVPEFLKISLFCLMFILTLNSGHLNTVLGPNKFLYQRFFIFYHGKNLPIQIVLCTIINAEVNKDQIDTG